MNGDYDVYYNVQSAVISCEPLQTGQVIATPLPALLLSMHLTQSCVEQT